MANFVIGDLWDSLGKNDLVFVTTNGFIKNDGCLVMGRGAAKDATFKYPDVARNCGMFLTQGNFSINSIRVSSKQYLVYGATLIPYYDTFGIFQVKYVWWEQADRGLISLSTDMLTEIANRYSDVKVRLNFPGIGNGGLSKEVVLPIVSRLPKNVFIYTKD